MLYKVPQDRYWAYKYADVIKEIAKMLNEKQQQPPQPPQPPQPQTMYQAQDKFCFCGANCKSDNKNNVFVK